MSKTICSKMWGGLGCCRDAMCLTSHSLATNRFYSTLLMHFRLFDKPCSLITCKDNPKERGDVRAKPLIWCYVVKCVGWCMYAHNIQHLAIYFFIYSIFGRPCTDCSNLGLKRLACVTYQLESLETYIPFCCTPDYTTTCVHSLQEQPFVQVLTI